MAKFSNGLFTITGVEYGIDDFAEVEGVGLCPIKYNPEYPNNTKVLINDVYYELDEFMRL